MPELITLSEIQKRNCTLDVSAHQPPDQSEEIRLYFDVYVGGQKTDPVGYHECFVAHDVQLRGGLKLFSTDTETEPCSIPISMKNARHLYKDLKRIFDAPN